MKMKKLYSIIMISMFIIGMLPAAFAQELIEIGSDRIGVEARDSAGIQAAPTPRAVSDPIVLRPLGEPRSGIGRVNSDSVSIERIDDVEKTRRHKDYKSLVHRNKGKIKSIFNDLKENYDEEKAIKFVTFAARVNENSIDIIERMMDRAENSPRFLENHPNALERMEEVRGELYESYDIFYNAVSDDAMSEEEYMELTDELRTFGKKLQNFSQNDKVRAFAKEHREEITKKLRNRYGNNPKVLAHIERLERSESSEERQEAMEEVRTSIVEVSDVDVELSEDMDSEEDHEDEEDSGDEEE